MSPNSSPKDRMTFESSSLRGLPTTTLRLKYLDLEPDRIRRVGDSDDGGAPALPNSRTMPTPICVFASPSTIQGGNVADVAVT